MSEATSQLPGADGAAVPEHVQAQVDDIKAKIADPATPVAHKTFLNEVLRLILKFLPAIIDLFHPTTGTTLPTGSGAGSGAASGSVAGPGASAGDSGSTGGGDAAGAGAAQ